MFTFSLLFTGYIAANLNPFLSGVTLRPGCAHACLDHANCSSFFYDSNSGDCYLEKYVYVASDQLLGREGIQYYSQLNSACPATYIYSRYTNQCLRLYRSPLMRFRDAQPKCGEDSGHIAFIKSEDDNIQASIVANDNHVWIGLGREDINAGWRWTNGHSLGPYNNWSPGLENSSDQIYARMFSDGMWGGSGIAMELSALCEIDVEVEDTALWCEDK
ncbi:uncharacterized protein [Haliotis cracherodii]|uniref:uncharacterized protein n=1 Tax=Haliotis cracherodii TaxID=6455 RepID=UPI0039E91C22